MLDASHADAAAAQSLLREWLSSAGPSDRRVTALGAQLVSAVVSDVSCVVNLAWPGGTSTLVLCSHWPRHSAATSIGRRCRQQAG